MKTEVSEQSVTVHLPAQKWMLKAVAEGVVLISAVPAGYQHTEQLSDAVVPGKPYSGTEPKTRGNTITIGGVDFAFTGSGFDAAGARLAQLYKDGQHHGFQFIIDPEEHFYGGGSRALPLNRNGQRFSLYNAPWYGYEDGADNLNYSVPFISSSKGYGLFFNNVSKGFVDIGKAMPGQLLYGAESGALHLYLIRGNSQKEILKKYMTLTGHQPLPPRWAMGNFMSRFGYVSEKQTNEIAGAMKQASIPFDAIIFDLFWFGDSIQRTMGNLDWVNKKAWPDPAGMIARFKKQHIHSVLITEPFVVNTARTYTASLPFQAVKKNGQPYVLTDFYFGNGGLLDLFRPESQNWFWKAYKKQMQIGVEGWWGDLGEPEKHPADMYHNLTSKGHKRLFSANEIHNLYGHQWTKFLYEKFAAEYPEKRLFSLNRSGFAGTQRYGIFPWSGDVSRNWSGFRAQLPIMLGMTMSGVPYMHADAGGFAMGQPDTELYLRWLQFACYTPIFRPHGTALYEKDRNAFSWPSEPALMPEPTRKHAREIVMQRYRMLPYNYTLAYLQASKGIPLASPLYYNFEEDTATAGRSQEYMWGPDLLVAPVVQPGEHKKEVYLPEGKGWYRWQQNELLEGGKMHTESLTETAIPVFASAGSFIPLIPSDKKIATTHDCRLDTFDLHYHFSDSASEGWLYDDDGMSKSSLSREQYQLFHFTAMPAVNGHQMNLSFSGKGYTGMPVRRHINLIVHGLPAGYSRLLINGNPASLSIQNKVARATLIFEGKNLSWLIKE